MSVVNMNQINTGCCPLVSETVEQNERQGAAEHGPNPIRYAPASLYSTCLVRRIIQKFFQSTRSMETYINAKAKVIRNQEHCGLTVNDMALMERGGAHCDVPVHSLSRSLPTNAPHYLPLSIPFNALTWLPPLARA